MSLQNPRREAFHILRRVEDAGAFASVLLARRAGELTDPRDAALLTEIVLGVLRRRAWLDVAIAAAAGRPIDDIDPAVLTVLRIGAYTLLVLDRVPEFAAVDTAVALVKETGSGRAAGFVNGALRRIARERETLLPPPPEAGDVAALARFRSHPSWWTRRLVDRFGWEGADALLAANNEPAATVLAPWSRSPEDLALSLSAEGVVTAPCRFVPRALRVVSGVPQRTAAFREGALWIQDEASQLAVCLFGDDVGSRVLDVCAAPGGKTLALASRAPAGGLVVAVDRHAKRLVRLAENVRRLAATNVVALSADMTRESAVEGVYDDVLVDAPCSGTGTLRRHPEIRWRLKPEDLSTLAARQRRILSAAADRVRPGGRLVYAVCSVEPEEGEAVIEAFLAERPEFGRDDPRGGLSVAARALVGPDLALRSSPLNDGMDGFFATLMTRRSQ